jgi:hypothetical protein
LHTKRSPLIKSLDCIDSLITQVVEQKNVGGTLGLSAAVGSLTRVIAPTISGFAIGSCCSLVVSIARAR